MERVFVAVGRLACYPGLSIGFWLLPSSLLVQYIPRSQVTCIALATYLSGRTSEEGTLKGGRENVMGLVLQPTSRGFNTKSPGYNRNPRAAAAAAAASAVLLLLG